MTTTVNSKSLNEELREVFCMGFHPTASRAVTLISIANEHCLCPFTVQHVLSFCVDATRVLVVDISGEEQSDVPAGSGPPTCVVVVDDHPRQRPSRRPWSESTPPKHFIFFSRQCATTEPSTGFGNGMRIM
eukprot:PhM_4_TR2078/c1_g2_i5/m.47596